MSCGALELAGMRRAPAARNPSAGATAHASCVASSSHNSHNSQHFVPDHSSQIGFHNARCVDVRKTLRVRGWAKGPALVVSDSLVDVLHMLIVLLLQDLLHVCRERFEQVLRTKRTRKPRPCQQNALLSSHATTLERQTATQPLDNCYLSLPHRHKSYATRAHARTPHSRCERCMCMRLHLVWVRW